MMPNGPQLNATFAYGNSPRLSPTNVYLVEHGRNIVYSFYDGMISKLRYDTDKDYSLCVIANGMMYYYSKEKFKEAVKTKNPTINLDAVPENMASVGEFKNMLGV